MNKMDTLASPEILYPIEAAKFVAAHSQDVTIRLEGIEDISELILEGLKNQDFQLSDWKKLDVNPKAADNFAIDWIFFVDLLNFSFWADEDGQYCVAYNNKIYTGYFSLCAAVQKAIANGIPLTDPKYYATINKDQLGDILRSESGAAIPLLDDRHNALTESGKILINKFDGSFVNCLKLCNGSAQVLMKLITENFPSFRDEAVYNGKRVAFYKRAQILIGDLWACFENKDLGEFYDIDTITMFADYRVPQVLAYFGVLEYSESLMNILQQNQIMINGSLKEVEIRGCSIWAVELIKENMAKLVLKKPHLSPKLPINSIMIDFFLWEYRRKHSEKMEEIPFHRVRCIYY